MPRFALKISTELLTTLEHLTGTPTSDTPFADHAYMVVEFLGEREFKMKLVTEDEIYVEAANDPDMQIMSV